MSERIYDIDGLKLPSVTTILGCLNKPALVPWAAKITAEAVQQLIYDNGIHNLLDGTVTLSFEDDSEGRKGLENILLEAKKAHRTKKKEAADLGTLVHEAIQHWIESNGTMQPSEIADERVRRGLESFLAWGEQHDVEIISFEQVVSDKLTYAGRYDLLATINQQLTLLDFKTSSGIWPEYWLQVAAYAACIEPEPQQTAVLLIDKETGEFTFESRGNWQAHAEAFKALADFYQLNKRLEGKRGNQN